MRHSKGKCTMAAFLFFFFQFLSFFLLFRENGGFYDAMILVCRSVWMVGGLGGVARVVVEKLKAGLEIILKENPGRGLKVDHTIPQCFFFPSPVIIVVVWSGRRDGILFFPLFVIFFSILPLLLHWEVSFPLPPNTYVFCLKEWITINFFFFFFFAVACLWLS